MSNSDSKFLKVSKTKCQLDTSSDFFSRRKMFKCTNKTYYISAVIYVSKILIMTQDIYIISLNNVNDNIFLGNYFLLLLWINP